MRKEARMNDETEVTEAPPEVTCTGSVRLPLRATAPVDIEKENQE